MTNQTHDAEGNPTGLPEITLTPTGAATFAKAEARALATGETFGVALRAIVAEEAAATLPPLPFKLYPFPRSMSFPAEVDGQPYDLFWFEDATDGGWHRVTELVASEVEPRMLPWVLTVCTPSMDLGIPNVMDESELTTAIPASGERADCECWS